MDTSRPIRVAISGAAGRVAYALLFRIASGGLFGKEQPIALSLLDLPERLNLLEGRAAELRECAFPLLHGLRFGSDQVQMFREADWVILLGGKPFSSGSQSLIDLLGARARSSGILRKNAGVLGEGGCPRQLSAHEPRPA